MSDGAGGTTDEHYDTVVVGGGLGGLSAAAFLAQAGQRVLVLERGDGPGGYGHAFPRGPYLFDPAVHLVEEVADGRPIDLLLRHLGVRDQCEFVPVPELYRVRFPGLDMVVPAGREAFVDAHAQRFPQEADGLRRLFDLHACFFAEAVNLSMQLSLREADEAVERFPTFFRYRRATHQQVLDDFLHDPRLKALCATMWPGLGLPPSRLSFYYFSQFLSILVDGGYHYSRGSFQRVVDALVSACENAGGTVLSGQEVERIVVRDGVAQGVRLAGGRDVRASVVVSNADAIQTFERLVGPEHTPARLRRRLRRMEPSLSAFVVFAATDLALEELRPAHETFVYHHWDHDATYGDVLGGRPAGMWATVPTLTDPSLAPPGEHLVIISSLAPYDIGRPWGAAKAGYTEQALAAYEPVFPGLTDHLTFVEAATPLAFERFTLNHRGATYGWANTPEQTGTKRLSHDTPIRGLYLSGHWTFEGTGSFRAMLSGMATARMVLERAGRPDAVPVFRPVVDAALQR